jgi:hypothetical protein
VTPTGLRSLARHGASWRISIVTEDWQSAVQDLAVAAQDAFLLPGDLMLSVLLSYAPALIHRLGVDSDANSHIVSLAISVLFWLLVVWVLWILLGLLRRIAWYAKVAIRIAAFRMSLGLHNLQVKLRRGFRHITPHRWSSSGSELAEVHFDDLDLAVLRSSGRLGPGFATSAPDLAAELSLRPAQVQQSLDKLRKYRMLDIATGSSDGFHNYHVSRSGFLFLKSWLQQAHHA